MTDLFHKILVHLYETNSLHQDKDITPFLINNLGDNNHNQAELQNVARTLHRLINSKFITHFSVPILGQLANGSPTNYLEEHTIRVNLELLGYNYIADKITQDKQEKLLERQTAINEQSGQSVIETNSFSVKNTRKTNRLFWLTFAVALISALGTVAGVILNYQQQKLQQDQVLQGKLTDSLQTQLKSLKSSLFLQQKSIDSLFRVLNDKKK